MTLTPQMRYQEGTIEQKPRKKGPDIWTYRWKDHASGKRRRVTLGTVKELRTLQAVKQAADGYRLSANKESDAVRDVAMAAVLDRYEREYVTPFAELPLGAEDNGAITCLTAKSYRSYIKCWIRPRWEKYLITDFTKPQIRSAIETWLAGLCDPGKLAPKTARNIGKLLSLIFQRSVKWGYLDRDPMEYVDMPKGSTRRQEKPRSLSPAEYIDLLELFGPRERLAVEIAGWLGTRRSEGFGLKWKDLDLEKGVVSFRQGFVSGRFTRLKNEASRTEISLPGTLQESLVAWRKTTPYSAEEDWVFASPDTNGQRPIWPDSMLDDHIQPVAEKAGFGKIGWHTFRHSFTSWGKASLKLNQTKELARHASIQTTSDLYGGLSLEEKRKAQKRLEKYVRREAKKPPVKAAS